jgi:calcium-binding protein CML
MQEGAKEISDVLDVITMSYLLFDTRARGFISKPELEKVIAAEGRGGGTSAFLSKERWAEMDWDHNGTISFEEFVFAFYAWVDDDESVWGVGG